MNKAATAAVYSNLIFPVNLKLPFFTVDVTTIDVKFFFNLKNILMIFK